MSDNFSEQCGVFQFGGLQLGVPLDCLREVIPYSNLAPFPKSADCVIGGINLRGVIIPVLDLGPLLGQNTEIMAGSIIIILTISDRVVGILADFLQGVLTIPLESRSIIEVNGAELPLCNATFPHPDNSNFISMLSTDAILAIKNLPLVSAKVLEKSVVHDIAEQFNTVIGHLMLFQVGRLCMAIETAPVYSTILDPVITDSTITAEYYVGDIAYAGLRVPAVSMSRLFGVEPLGEQAKEAFIIRYGDGMVAFMVDSILDVIQADSEVCQAIPNGTLPNPEYFSGAISVEDLTISENTKAKVSENYFLIVNAMTFLQSEMLNAISSMTIPITNEDTQHDVSVSRKSNNLAVEELNQIPVKMLVYNAGFEVATEISQVVEILACTEKIDLFSEPGRARGLFMNRGKAVPVFCLNSLIGQPPSDLTPTSSILVVESNHQFIGFMVSELLTIEEMIWSKGSHGEGPSTPKRGFLKDVSECWSVVRIQSNSTKRTLSALNLEKIAAHLIDSGESKETLQSISSFNDLAV
ncbi:chemotaxis protein CheW [Thalassolituus oleivorans]|uniref:chemotaxis protein CheW n=1 Tax=Thalassolituus oleivorans TaxID=187493 RepID=UPI0023F13060|nr:chemotaxis protein CheW [Thalassolituus oleivorans]